MKRLAYVLFTGLILTASFLMSARSSATQDITEPQTGWTCSVLCGYYLESAINYDPSQDITISYGASPGLAFFAAKQACVNVILGEGKFKEREYPILLVEESASSGAVTVRATVNNACVKN